MTDLVKKSTHPTDLEERRKEFLRLRGISPEAFQIFLDFDDNPALMAEVRKLQQTPGLLDDYLDLATERPISIPPCSRCGGVLDERERVGWSLEMQRHRWPTTCASCIDAELWRLSSPPSAGIHTAIYRARRARLQATLTEDEWAATVAHFIDRCAFCVGPWHVVTHLVPIELGGGTVKNNCVPACTWCNGTKGRQSLFSLAATEWPSGRIDTVKDFYYQNRKDK